MGRYYRVGEVAALTRVSVRTLHHYDRIGLLRPALHSPRGYRLYGETELLRLQQILTLRYLGFPLKRIGELLDRDDFNLLASLRVQRLALHDRIAELERISAAIGDLVEQRLATPPEEIEAIERNWTALLTEIRAARAADLDPASAEAGSLADRWVELSRQTIQHFPDDLRDAIKTNYERGAFEGHDRAPQAEDFAFIARIEATRASASGNSNSEGERNALREAK